MIRNFIFVILIAATAAIIGCAAPKFNLFPDAAEPLKEFTLQGKGKEKVLVIPVNGKISDSSREKMIGGIQPSMVQEIVSQLKLAEKDKNIRSVLFKINSPGGSVTASDILYYEILSFKQRTDIPIVASLMGVAASGGYYISLPADSIFAHPTTVTGSVGVLFLQPKVNKLMGKIGLGVEVSKSGKNKDMGSPFRETTIGEEKMFQMLTEELGHRFINLVAEHRRLDIKTLGDISSARIYLADEALSLGLVDKIGYLDDALSEAKKLAGLPENAKVVVYRRTKYPDDNLYNTAAMKSGAKNISLIDLEQLKELFLPEAGFYYLWQPAVSIEFGS
ncbi:MAG TPA: signal peptide peptidase SppA [Desulfobacteraceae bacterium]|nr:signal peptide peptidase SppA [Desulfobacteraceae bacterium]